MRKYLPVMAVVVFVVALLGLSNYIWIGQEQVRAERIREAEHHLVVYSDMPIDVNNDLAKKFYEQTHLRVQIITKNDGDIQSYLKSNSKDTADPDIIIAVQPLLQTAAKQGRLKPYASEATDQVAYAHKDADGYWVGLWYDPMVLVISREYYAHHGLQLQNWNDLLADPDVRIAFPDLAATDIAGDFLCTFVEIYGQENAMRYFKNIQRHVAVYSKSMTPAVWRVASGEADVGVVDAVTARQLVKDAAPIYILYPQDGTSCWLVGAGVTVTCQDEELSGKFMDWLLSKDTIDILRKSHLYLDYTANRQGNELDAKGQQLVLFQAQKNYTEQGRKEMQDWWIKMVRFGKES